MNPSELFTYDPDTGELWWLERRSNRVDMSRRAGSQNAQGYWQVRYNGRVYSQHRLIWEMVHGYKPSEIDHIDQDKSNNRLDNLRECTHSENIQARWDAIPYPKNRKSRISASAPVPDLAIIQIPSVLSLLVGTSCLYHQVVEEGEPESGCRTG